MNYTTWIEIKKSALDHNINQYRLWLPQQTGIAPVIKANAYGHGLTQIGLLHDQNPSITRLCVANSQEGVQLRQHGITKPILVLGFINTPLETIAQYNLDMIVSDEQTIKDLNKLGQTYGKKINIHLKIDTGLSRMGIIPQEFQRYMNLIQSCTYLLLQGICSHLIQACEQNSVHEQEELLNPFRQDDIEFHTVNSHGSLLSKYHYSFARIGAGLYGYLPEADPLKQQELHPILSLKTRVIGLKTISAGQTVGYAKTYTANKPTILAVLGMGYYEGIDPDLANTGRVLIHGQFAPIVGRINMNYFTVDVTHIPQTKHYDIATVLGHDGNHSLSAYDWRIGAKKNVRIFLARLNDAIPRIVID
ncbi:MAG TPA: alanine racemase [Candidatus Saccharimonadales bacterium]|nr:alanine racemase [Candidatus Saccharimonadales bacterium]